MLLFCLKSLNYMLNLMTASGIILSVMGQFVQNSKFDNYS